MNPAADVLIYYMRKRHCQTSPVRRSGTEEDLVWTRVSVALGALIAVLVAIPWLLGVGLGGQLVQIEGTSMEPTLERGTVVAVKDEPTEQLDVGEVVLVQTVLDQDSGPVAYAHRVVSIDGEELTLKGDNNEAPDPITVPTSDVEGVVTDGFIPEWSSLLAFWMSPVVRWTSVGMAVILLAMPELVRLRLRRRAMPVMSPKHVTSAGIG